MQFPPPENWQDFERLTRAVCVFEWGEPDAEILGRPGQAQHGVDVLGWDTRYGRRRRVGVQCKRRSMADADGKTLCGGAVTMDDIKNALKMAEALSLGLDSFVLATTALRDARLQEQIAAFNETRRNQQECEVAVWFWEWFEEKLNRDVTVGRQFYSEILEAHGLSGSDRVIAGQLRSAFNRALMKTKLEHENQIGSVIKGTTLLQHLLATGYLNDGDGNFVGSCSPPRAMNTAEDRRSIDFIEARLQTLRVDVTQCEARGDIRDGGNGWIIIRNMSVAPRLDALRAEIVSELNRLLERHGIDPLESQLLQP